VNQELPDEQSRFQKGRGTRDQIANICWIIEKAREFQKKVYLCFIDYANAFDCVTTNCEKFLKRWEFQTILPVTWETYMWVKKQQLGKKKNNIKEMYSSENKVKKLFKRGRD